MHKRANKRELEVLISRQKISAIVSPITVLKVHIRENITHMLKSKQTNMKKIRFRGIDKSLGLIF